MSNKKNDILKDGCVGEGTNNRTEDSQIMASRRENTEVSKVTSKEKTNFKQRSLFTQVRDYDIAQARDLNLTVENQWTFPSRHECMVVSDSVLPFIGATRFLLVHDTFGKILSYLTDLGYGIVKVCFLKDVLFIFITKNKDDGAIVKFKDFNVIFNVNGNISFGGFWKDLSIEGSIIYLYQNRLYIRHGGKR